jgi:V8-like Glu-specific endopeptidase
VDVSAALAALAPPAATPGKASTVPSVPPAAGGAAGAAGGRTAALDAAFSVATGKVYATYPWRTTDKDIACSGAAVASARRRLVVTAAHCVYDAPRHGFAVNWVFIPAFQNNDQNPYGQFPALTMGVRSNWTNDRNFHSDYAFVVTGNSERGQRVVDAVGGHGLHFNGGYPDVHIIGYPGSGGYQTTCESSTTRASLWEDFIQANCRMRGGSSGGPWLRDFDHATGRGNVATVTSFDDAGEPTHLFAPDFDSNARELYNATEAQSPAS